MLPDLVVSEVQGTPGSPHPPAVILVPCDPGLPARTPPGGMGKNCDCACFAVKGEELPLLSAPLSFYLELTPTCNNHCPGCGNAFVQGGHRRVTETPGVPLDAKGWNQILDKLRPYAYRLKVTGGEPTLHPEFFPILAHLARLDLPFTLFTNGRWPDPERLTGLLRGIPSFEGFLLSLHGPTAASHQAFTRTPGSFAGALSGLRAAAQAGLPTALSCILTQHNWQLVDEMVQVARDHGAGVVVFNRYLGQDIPGLTASPQQLKAAVDRVQALRATGEPVKLGNCLPACFAPAEQTGCLAGLAFFTVDPWGQARPCNHTPQICGDLLRHSVDEIWRSPVMDRWRNARPEPCATCAAFATCRGGCRAQALATGRQADPLIGAPLRPINEEAGPVLLYEQARPVGNFARRPEAFGTLLLSGSRLQPVGRDLEATLDMLDGQFTLRQIETAHGQPGLTLVANLYRHGMVELKA